jgi:rod shape-determining protein MreC
LTLVLLIITSLALVSLDERGSGLIDSARTAAQDVVAPVQDLADDVINPVSDWLDGLGRANELQDENAQLRRQLDAARAQIATGKADQVELENLRAIADLPDIADGDAVTAQVVDQGAGNFSRTLRISKGSSDGIALDQPVVVQSRDKSATALVGRVARVSTSYSIVERIDDANFGAGAQLMQPDKEGPPGTAEGQRDSNLLRFSVIDNDTSVSPKKGDIAITLGGVDNRYPRGLVIGTVVRSVGGAGAIKRDAELRPVVDLDALTFVKVLRYPPVAIP